DTQGHVVLDGDLRDVGDLVADRLLALVVPQVAGVVPDLVDVRRHDLREAVVLLEVHREVGVDRLHYPRAHLGEGVDVLLGVAGDANEIRAGGVDQGHLPRRRLDVLGLRGGHALHGDRGAAAHLDRANAHRPRGLPTDRRHTGTPL